MSFSHKPICVRTYSAPGKTFLLGEYAVLEGGPAILAATGPRFVLTVDKTLPFSSPFHPESPAGILLKSLQTPFEGEIRFYDPHQGLGGLGASSAQVALVFAAHADLSEIEYQSPQWQSLLREFQKISQLSGQRQPSGGDLIAQMAGGLVEFHGRDKTIKRLNWSFSDLSFTLIRTGQKLKTHEHLSASFSIPKAELQAEVARALEALGLSDETAFVESVNAFALSLQKAGLTAPTTLQLLERMRNESDLFLAVKGCGALGADVVLAVHRRSRESEVQKWAEAQRLVICGGLESLSGGVRQDPESETEPVHRLSSELSK